MARAIAELEKLPTKELRKLASQMKRVNPSLVFVRDGLEFSASKIASNGRKDECVYHISMWEGQLEKDEETPTIKPEQKVKPEPKTKTKLESKQKTEPKIIAKTEPSKAEDKQPENEYSESEHERLILAKKLYESKLEDDELTGLKEYQLKLCQEQKYFLPAFGILIARARVMIEAYANNKSPEGKAHPGTIQKIRVEVSKKIGEFVERDKDKFPAFEDIDIASTYKAFDDALRGAFADIGSIKYQLNKAKNEKAEEDVRAIEVLPFIGWAENIVKSIDELQPRDWKKVAVAIMLLTGRRQSEVMSSGEFKVVDDANVVFSGQLKRHTDEVVEAETIPILANCANEVVAAIEKLNEWGKRTVPVENTSKAIQEAAKQSHNRCSRYIAETMRKLQKLVKVTNGKTWYDGNGKNLFKGHITRQIYAQTCSKLFKGDDRKTRAYISRILLENRDAALVYDRDIEIKDADKIQEQYGGVGE